jgi:hypothetical protein
LQRREEREEREESVPDCLVVVAFRVRNDGAVNTMWGSVLATATIEVHNHAIHKAHFLGVRVHSLLCHHRALVDTLLNRPFTRLIVVASRRKKAPKSLDLTIKPDSEMFDDLSVHFQFSVERGGFKYVGMETGRTQGIAASLVG